MKQQQDQNKQAVIFTNGPYQLMVGVACARFHIRDLEQIDVITYDMKWQKDLKRTTDEIINILNLNRVNFIFEFKKSDITNAHTYPIRAGLNHLTFYLYGLLQKKENVFIPKLYGSPERAIILSSINKQIFIYDDGFGMYLDPRINQNKLDIFLYKYINKFRSQKKTNIGIFPRKPSLMEYSNFNQIAIARDDYSTELFEILKLVAENFKERISRNLSENHKGKTNLLIALPRLSLSNKKRIGEEISQLIEQIIKINFNTYFVLKPHPRDIPQDYDFLNDIIGMHSNWEFLPSFASCLPIEVIAISLGARIILSGWSTIGINQDLVPGTNVMIYEFLGFDIPHYNDHAKRLMVKSGTFSGKTVQDAVEKIKFLLTNV